MGSTTRLNREKAGRAVRFLDYIGDILGCSVFLDAIVALPCLVMKEDKEKW